MKSLRLWAACLALVPFSVCPVSAQAPAKAPSPAAPALIGPVTKISIAGLKNISLDTVQAKMTLKAGDAYTPEAAQKDVGALKGMGVFNGQVSVAATPASPSGVSLTYTVAENPIVRSIRITANTPSGQPSVPAADLIAQMRTQVGQVLNTNTLVSDLSNLFNHSSPTAGYVVKQGYLVDVSSDINIDPKTGVLTIPLVECYIKSIEITGNSRVKTADILAQMHTKSGDLYNAKLLQNDLSAIYEMGEFRQVGPFQVNSSVAGELKITVPVVEQPAATGILDEKQGKVIPFLYDPPIIPYPVVQLSVNGQPPLLFVVDTGSSPEIAINPWAAKELGLKVSGKPETENGVTFTRVPIMGVTLEGQNESNNAVFGAKEVEVLDLSVLNRIAHDTHIAGIIGLGMLLPVTSRFDFAAKTLTLFTASHPPLHISQGTVLPLRVNAYGTLSAHASFAPDNYADLIVDTGSDATQIPLSALAMLHPTAVAFNVSARIDRTYVSPRVRLPRLTIGSLRVPNVEAETLPADARFSLGLNVLGDYRLTLDVPNMQLILEPSAEGSHSIHVQSGVAGKPEGKGWTISQFSDISPAHDAGLQLGDQLVTVAGTSVEGLSEAQVRKLFQVPLGTALQVRARRDGKEIPFSWVPLDDLVTSPTAVDGLSMQKAPGGSWTVVEAMKGCPGDKAGLKAGDTLTKIDGEATATMPLERFLELIDQSAKTSVIVEMERPGVAQPFTVWLTVPK